MYVLTYRKAFVFIITILTLLNAIAAILNQLGFIHYGVKNDFSQYISILIFLIGIPAAIYWSTKRNYNSNKKIQEHISYSFSGEEVTITGESFNSIFNLNGSYKIQELNKWFLIYQSNRTVNIIPKSNLSGLEMEEMRNIFRNLNNVKIKLKQS